MQENYFINTENPRTMYAIKNRIGEIMLSTLSGTEEVCKERFIHGSKLTFTDLEKEGWSTVKLSVFFKELSNEPAH